MTELTKTDRRTFFRRTVTGAGALWVGSLQEFAVRKAFGDTAGGSPYGPVSPKADETTGLRLLQLPDGFRYWSYSWTGDVMSDGVMVPPLHDGMAVVDEWHGDNDDDDHERWGNHGRRSDGDDDDEDAERDDVRRRNSGHLILVRNHEAAVGVPYVVAKPEITYAADGAGGTTNLMFDARQGKWLRAWSSLAGTQRNCAGGVTPWGTWITGEETTNIGHGWHFEVGPLKGNPKPLVSMGRFSHEADMVDPRTGYVYETEDADLCGFYKFVPHRRGRLHSGGRLYMLRVKGKPHADLGLSYPVGTSWSVEWVRIDDPTAAEKSCYNQGAEKGGATFRRLEGAWWGDGTGYFLSTNGGAAVVPGSPANAGEGQVFEYDPRGERLTLIYESPNAEALENPDNITVTPRGGLLLCEDNAGINAVRSERLIGLTLNGQTFVFAINNINFTEPGFGAPPSPLILPNDYRTQEWAGACYSPDGRWLFVNIQTPGVTFAITGPWGRGPL